MTANDEIRGMKKEMSLPISKVTYQHLLAVKTHVGIIQNTCWHNTKHTLA
jgi:hypothetical protein